MKAASGKSTIAVALAALTLFAGLALAEPARAQATRTWVSGVGDDANPCSRTAPCKTFAGAISKTAAKGEIDVLDPGGFGAVTITKAITISSEGGGEAGVVVSGTNAIVVAAGASDVVTLRGLVINGLGTSPDGIRFISGKALHVEKTLIFGFQNGIDVIPTTTAGTDVSVADTTVRECGTAGISVENSAGPVRVDLDHVRIHDTPAAVHASAHARVHVADSDLSQNGTGILADAPTAAVFTNGSQIAFNGTGVRATAGGRVVLSGNNITANNTGIDAAGGGIVSSFGDNGVTGNKVNGAPTARIAPR